MYFKNFIKICFILILLIPIDNLFPQETTEYVAEAVEISPSEAPKIDGKFDDPVWKKANMITNFTQHDPTAGAPATEKSEIYILYDKENLYVGCILYDLHPENIINELRRREEIISSDRIELFFDTFHNHRTGYKFSMNPYGVQMDDQRYNDDAENRDWDGIWKSAAEINDVGWIAEFKIPFFNMRFPDREEQIWGFNVRREIRYKAEISDWKPVSIHDRGDMRMSTLGHLMGIKGIRPGRSLEVYPYGLSGFSETSETSRIGKNEVGFDLKYGISSDVTLDMTVNPDYAQVDADVLQINLTRYPTQFPEKRKFFLEGSGIFQTPTEIFYSRRIGAKGDILWGTKMTGRTKKGGLEFGVLTSQTGDWNYFGLGNKDSSKEEALYGIARVQKGFSNGSSIGMIVTDKEAKNNNNSRIFGIDGLFIYKGIYRSNFQISTSQNSGLLNNNNYYSFGIFRYTIPWTIRITALRFEPNYDINSTGFMNKEQHRGQQNFRTVLIYNPFIEKKGIRQINVFTSLLIGQDIFTKVYINNWIKNYHDVSVEPRYLAGKLQPNYYTFDQSYSIRATNEMNIGYWYALGRTNELNKTYQSNHQGFNISSPRTGKIQKLSANLNYDWGTFYNFAQKYLGSNQNIGGGGTSWIRSNLGLELTGQYSKTFDPEGVLDGRYFRLSMRNTYLLTKDIFIRLFTQGRWGTTYYGEKSINNTYLLSFLLGWEFKPGSWFYLAFNEGREDLNNPNFQERDFLMTDRTLVAKIQYALHK